MSRLVPEMQLLLSGRQPQPGAAMHGSFWLMARHSGQQAPCATCPVSAGQGVCTPVHVPLQKWHAGSTVHSPQLEKLAQYSSALQKPLSLMRYGSLTLAGPRSADTKATVELATSHDPTRIPPCDGNSCFVTLKNIVKLHSGMGPTTAPSVY